MNRLERLGDFNESLLAAVAAAQSVIWTSLPGIIESYDAAKMTCSVRIAIKALASRDGAYDWVSMPKLVDVPVIFPNGGGFVLTFPVTAGDECLVMFSSRCIDSWWQLGGEQPPFEYRMHDLSDGFALLGPRSQPRKVPSPSTTSVELRSEDGTAVVQINAAKEIKLVSPTKVRIEAPDVEIDGAVAITGSALTHNGVNVGSTHIHGNVRSGGDLSGVPQ